MTQQEFADLPIPVALVVDDEPLILMDTCDMVADEGFHVIEARTADDALKFIREHTELKLLFTDVQVPGQIDGIELAQYVGEHWPTICVIVASGAVKPDDGVLPDNARFIQKPITPHLVQAALMELNV